jgi:hypothetical protein
MGVGLYLRGRLVTPIDDPLAAVERFFRHRYRDDLLSSTRSDAGSLLQLTTHPASAPIDVTLDGARITFAAKTSTVGPGYHADLCDTLHALGSALDVEWEPPDEEEGTGDDTGYFVTGDHDALESEMLRWLQRTAGVLLEHQKDHDTGLSLSMPLSPRYHGPPDAALLTQMGPRDADWLRRVHDDPHAGIDVFPWWAAGRGASYELGRVLVHLWLDVRFDAAFPGGDGTHAATDEEKSLGRELLARLDRAYRADSTLDYPWAAWGMLHDDVVDADDDDLSEMIRDRADADEGTIGYRAWDVDLSLADGWAVTVPGSFSTQFDEDGTWSAWEHGYAVWVTAFSRSKDGVPAPAEEMFSERSSEEGTAVVIEGLEKPYLAYEDSFEEDGDEYWRITAQVARPGRMLLVTVVVPEEESLDWARAVIASVRG